MVPDGPLGQQLRLRFKVALFIICLMHSLKLILSKQFYVLESSRDRHPRQVTCNSDQLGEKKRQDC